MYARYNNITKINHQRIFCVRIGQTPTARGKAVSSIYIIDEASLDEYLIDVSGCYCSDIGHSADKMKLPVLVVLVMYSQCYYKAASVSGTQNIVDIFLFACIGLNKCVLDANITFLFVCSDEFSARVPTLCSTKTFHM